MTETVQQDEWTEQNCINLIEEFKKRPMLWDPNHDLYFKKHMKPQLWREISDAIGIPPKSCKHKIIVLMSSFRREKHKILQSVQALASSSPNTPAKKPYISSWFAFRKMSFLMDKMAKGANELSEKDSEALKEEGRLIKATLLEHSVDSPVFKKRKTNNPPTVKDTVDCEFNAMTPEEAIIYFDDENSDDGVMINPSLNPASPPAVLTTDTDEISSFANFIASKMRKYSEETKNAVQEEICEIIFRADNKKNNVNGNDQKSVLPHTSGISFVTKVTDFPNLFSA